MKALLAALFAVIVVSSIGLVWLEQPEWLPDEIAQEKQDRVLVFLVGDASGVSRVRDAVASHRVVYSSDRALALVEGRIVATNAAAVTEPMNQIGWRDRPIEIFHVERADPLRRRSRTGAQAEVDPERMARLRELVKKPTLSYGEQLFVLQAMNDGIEF